MAFYKTNAPTVLAAYDEFVKENEGVAEEAKAFADLFGGKPIYRFDFGGRRFYNLRFEPAADIDLWTKPNPDAGNAQHPRSALPKSVKGDRRKLLARELAALNDKFTGNYPRRKADLDAFWGAMGTDWGILLLHGAGFFAAADNTIYVKTSAPLNDCMTEILESEYRKAEEVARG